VTGVQTCALPIYYNRGVAHRKKGNYDQAIRDYDEAVRQDPSIALAYNDYVEAIHRDVRLAQDHFDRANSHRRKGNYSQAIQDLDEAIRLNPGLAAAFNVRAWILYLLKRNEVALPDAERAVSLAPNVVYNLGTKAHVLAALGHWTDSLAVFNQALTVADAKWIKSYQKALKRHGYYEGRVDGVSNPAISAALEACLKAGCRVIE
jgi:tetratricopeptide (TPR) repeat protein